MRVHFLENHTIQQIERIKAIENRTSYASRCRWRWMMEPGAEQVEETTLPAVEKPSLAERGQAEEQLSKRNSSRYNNTIN
jgi:hypothetical protein